MKVSPVTTGLTTVAAVATTSACKDLVAAAEVARIGPA